MPGLVTVCNQGASKDWVLALLRKLWAMLPGMFSVGI